MSEQENTFVFDKSNYMWLVIGILTLIVGFVLMSGGGSDDPDVFAGETLFNTRRLTIAPLTVLAGFGIIFYAILKKPAAETTEN